MSISQIGIASDNLLGQGLTEGKLNPFGRLFQKFQKSNLISACFYTSDLCVTGSCKVLLMVLPSLSLNPGKIKPLKS